MSLLLASQGLLIKEVGEDLLVYEPTTKIARALNSAAASVLVLCDAKTPVAEMVRELMESGAESDHDLERSVLSIPEEFKEIR